MFKSVFAVSCGNGIVTKLFESTFRELHLVAIVFDYQSLHFLCGNITQAVVSRQPIEELIIFNDFADDWFALKEYNHVAVRIGGVYHGRIRGDVPIDEELIPFSLVFDELWVLLPECRAVDDSRSDRGEGRREPVCVLQE